MSLSERGEILLHMAELLEPRIARPWICRSMRWGAPASSYKPLPRRQKRRYSVPSTSRASYHLREVRDGYLGKVVVLREPIGVVAGIIPWNAHCALVMSKMLPTLLTGCPTIIKPSPETP
jgi:aldehyde dehydrogenase (NAD+)